MNLKSKKDQYHTIQRKATWHLNLESYLNMEGYQYLWPTCLGYLFAACLTGVVGEDNLTRKNENLIQ